MVSYAAPLELRLDASHRAVTPGSVGKASPTPTLSLLVIRDGLKMHRQTDSGWDAT